MALCQHLFLGELPGSVQVLPGTGIAIVKVGNSHLVNETAASLASSECECPATVTVLALPE